MQVICHLIVEFVLTLTIAISLRWQSSGMMLYGAHITAINVHATGRNYRTSRVFVLHQTAWARLKR